MSKTATAIKRERTTAAIGAEAALRNEPLMPLVPAVEEATKRRPHLSTVLRWATQGCRGIRLESMMVGGRRMTSPQAVHRFNEALTAASISGNVSPHITPAQEDARARKAAKQLAARLA